jgi:hypothetical protein
MKYQTLLSYTRAYFYVLALLLPALAWANPCHKTRTDSMWLDPILLRNETAFADLARARDENVAPLAHRLQEINEKLQNPKNRTAECGFELLWERIQIEDAVRQINEDHELKRVKLRYQKGIEILKMLYEKILSMDHHFTGLAAQQELLKLSNPHNYPEFKEAKTMLEDKMKKKFDFVMPPVLQANPYISTAFSLVGLMLGSKDKDDKEKKVDVDKISCIMDFTVRMNADLSTIYYETGYLRDANLTLKKDCEALFTDCARQVGYTIPLEHCRNSDDWERLYGLMDNLVAKALGESSTGNTGNNNGGYNNGNNGGSQIDTKLSGKVETNLQFAVDRVLLFINRYSDFVNQGNEYYKKFAKITSSYENEKVCSSVMPEQFTNMKKDIEQTIDKFNSAYKMPEVQGSKLKDMMYGE